MVAKASIADVTNFGFDTSQFRSPANWDQENGFIDDILDDVSTYVQSLVGAGVYAAPSALQLYNLKYAEKYLTAAEMWRRMEQYKPAEVTIGRTGNASQPTVGSRSLKNAQEMEAIAWQYLGFLGVSPDMGGIKTGYVETGLMDEVAP